MSLHYSPSSNLISGSRSKQELSNWTKDEIVQRVLELEDELSEFQESSKELEKALEDELQTLEATNHKLTGKINERDDQLRQLLLENRRLKLQLNSMNDQVNNKKLEYETEVRNLKQQLVEVEIANDNMESNDRFIQNKLDHLSSFNLELIEKIALLENDLHLEKKSNIEKDLFIINYENTITDLNNKIKGLNTNDNRRSIPPSSLEANKEHKQPLNGPADNSHHKNSSGMANDETSNDHETSEVDILFLSMKDILNAGPPISPNTNNSRSNGSHDNNVKKSDSLQRMHDLLLKTEGLSQKVKSLRRESLYLNSPQIKSPSTTQVSNHYYTTSPVQQVEDNIMTRKENKENNNPRLNPSTSFEKSKSSKNLTTMLYNESKKPSSLDPISGSPNGTKVKPVPSKGHLKKKKSKPGNILGSWFR